VSLCLCPFVPHVRTFLETDFGIHLAVDFQPISVVENEGFRKLTTALNPAFQPITRQKACELIQAKYKFIQPIMLNYIRKADQISLTTDCWKSEGNQHHLTLTCHFIVGTKLNEIRLGTTAINREDGHSIASTIESMLVFWNIKKESIVCVVTDNGGGMPTAIRLLSLQRVPCIAHTLNLAVNDLFSSAHLDSIFKKCIKVVSEFRESAVANHQLQEIQLQLNTQKPLQLIRYIETRWNSRLYMLRRIGELKAALNLYWSQKTRDPDLSNNDFLFISDITLILNSSEQITKQLSGSNYPTLSMIIPLINITVKLLSKYSIDNESEQFRLATIEGVKIAQKFSAILSNRFKFADEPKLRPVQFDIEKHNLMREATILDARFKTIFFDSKVNAMLAKSEIVNQLCSMQRLDNVASSNESNSTSFFNLIDEYSSKDRDCNIDDYFSEYLLGSLSSSEANPLDQIGRFDFGHNSASFTSLQRKYFCIPATSAPSERVFSAAGYISSDRRNKLGNKLIDELIFLNHSLPIFNKMHENDNK
jgi:hypothetical protein